MKRFAWWVILVLLLAAPALAQQPPNHASLLKAVRADYPAQVNQKQAGEILARVVWSIKGEGFGLLRKDGGNRCPIPNSSTTVSCDWILHKPTGLGCDSLGDTASATSTGKASPNWCSRWEPMDMAKFVNPVDPGTTPPPPTPEPGPDPVLAEVTALREEVAALRVEIRALNDKVSELVSRPWPVYAGTLPFLGPLHLTPQVQ